MIGWLKSNWRVALLIVFILLSGFALFSPTLDSGDETLGNESEQASTLTNLKFGLDLAGGTRIRAPLIGLTADNVEFNGESSNQVVADVAGQLPNTDRTDVIARQATTQDGTNTVEVVNPNITETQFATAMDDAGYEYGEISQGVTDTTRQVAINVLEGKINQAGLSGGTVQEFQSSGDILIEVPGQDRQSVIELIEDRGNVRVDIYYQNDSGNYTTERAVLSQDDFQSISTASQGQNGQQPNVPVTIKPDSAAEFRQAAVDTGLAPGGSRCAYQESPENTEPCLLLVVDGEVVNSFGMDPGLGASIESGDWVQNPNFILTTTSFEEAQRIAINLRAGGLPAQLDVLGGTTSYISPTQGDNFRTYSLIIGVLSVLAVAGVVFARYREPKVALPMILTAFSEVVILLGFAAYLGYPLDLAVIAGFIAVIGTGVDDLIIIADEVMSEGEVSSQRVFDSRFKRAFWVIGVAAATTIIAMSPLAALPLGNLRGFAIFTILGVLVGVLITRPAYGDILRYLMTDR